MACDVTCPGCSETFTVFLDTEARWLECPHCGQAALNLSALQSWQSGWRICVGKFLLVILALLMSIVLANIGEEYTRLCDYASRSGLRAVQYGFLLGLAFLAPVSLCLSGVLFVRAGLRPDNRHANTLLAVCALLGAPTFIVLAMTLADSVLHS